jgi:2-hydroxy-3-keto-5-methylthiopentenyl-1-phosphate phosphatase
MEARPPAPRRRAIVLDFDGTMVDRDIGDEIADRFGPPLWRELDRRAAAGELSLAELQRRVWPEVRGPREAILGWVDERARFRPGLEPMLERAAAGGRRIVVASGGFDFYIERVLGRLGPLRERIEVVANRGVLRQGRVEISFPHAGTGCGRCGVCKGMVLERVAAAGFWTAFCGDGGSDGCAIGRAGALFAVRGSRLARRCEEAGAPFTAFETFDEIAEALLGD